MLGIPATYNQGSGFFVDVSASQYYAYAQDHWRVSDNLTLAYGMGYDVETPFENLQYGGVGVTCWFPNDPQSKVFPNAPPGILYPAIRDVIETADRPRIGIISRPAPGLRGLQMEGSLRSPATRASTRS